MPKGVFSAISWRRRLPVERCFSPYLSASFSDCVPFPLPAGPNKIKLNISNIPADVYQIARMKGTERPWTSKFENFHEKGTYYCAACGNALFRSDTKFESGCGWPSFYEPISKSSIIYTPDNTHGMERTEVQCGR